MADRVLFPDPPEDGVLVPAPVHEVEARAREFWKEAFTGDPTMIESFWEVIPGTHGYCAVLDYRRRGHGIKGISSRSIHDMSDLTEVLGFHFLGQRLYHLHFCYDDGPMVEAYEFHAFGDSEWIQYPRLRKLEPGIPKDPWDFAESRGVIVERWPAPEPPPPVSKACVVHDVTPEELHPFKESFDVTFRPTSRGTLIVGSRSSDVAINGASELKKTAYILRGFPTEGRFECLVLKTGELLGEFQSQPAPSSYPQIDSVLGETTPHGILRALEVPPELVGL